MQDVVENVRAAGILVVASAVTMIYGNVAALTQDNVKRMLAYSSIAHAGYLALGLLAILASSRAISASVRALRFGSSISRAMSRSALVTSCTP